MTSQPIIEIKELEKTFQTKNGSVSALKNINLQIQQGDIFGIIGMSGAGKSTLVRCMNLLERPTSGQVFLEGQDIARLNNKQLQKVRRSMGMIFQQFNLLMQRTAESNICFPLEISGISKKAAKERAKELLELVGLSDRAKSYPSQLSGGQKQRIAIARALASNPKVLLCDEATSALDPTTTASILALLKDINQRLGITVVIITHEMSVIEQICNRVAIIDQSQIAEVGFVEDIFSRPQTLAAQKLVFPEGHQREVFSSHGDFSYYRIVFDGNSSFEPVVANMVLEFKTPVNIMFADTKNIDGKAFGQIVIQVPQSKTLQENMLRYLRSRELTVEEVTDYVG
ncbi:methionine ABC transporter ATP-binding protein [Scatolibacter rhodanostii]|uniref:methionine ABC transporter ATP-binding protein n=1 Tax=Scatolibacter rhodanostii TaxID=2014781 RepID=UPI000C07E949|nr:ATP-binding cassette domain-containing protein [Scatolibacter rhodanostii]